MCVRGELAATFHLSCAGKPLSWFPTGGRPQPSAIDAAGLVKRHLRILYRPCVPSVSRLHPKSLPLRVVNVNTTDATAGAVLWVWMVVRFVCVIRLPVCARVSRVCPVFPGSPRCL